MGFPEGGDENGCIDAGRKFFHFSAIGFAKFLRVEVAKGKRTIYRGLFQLHFALENVHYQFGVAESFMVFSQVDKLDKLGCTDKRVHSIG